MEPVIEAANAVLRLHREVLGVGLGKRGRSDVALTEVVAVHEELRARRRRPGHRVGDDLEELFGDEPVRMTVSRLDGFARRRFAEAVDPAVLHVDPVGLEVDAELRLDGEILGVGRGDVSDGDLLELMNAHEKLLRHDDLLATPCGPRKCGCVRRREDESARRPLQ